MLTDIMWPVITMLAQEEMEMAMAEGESGMAGAAEGDS